MIRIELNLENYHYNSFIILKYRYTVYIHILYLHFNGITFKIPGKYNNSRETIQTHYNDEARREYGNCSIVCVYGRWIN